MLALPAALPIPGIMAERIAGGNIAIALLGNTLATGAILFVLITMLGPVSGAHMNPAVTFVMCMRGHIRIHAALAYAAAQLAGGIMGVWLARSEEHTSELQSLMRSSYAVFRLK